MANPLRALSSCIRRTMSTKSVKSIKASKMFLSQVVGEEALSGKAMQAGTLLKLTDLVAGRVAAIHSSSSVVTAAFERVDLLRPILHRDLVRLEGRLVHAGTTSMVVEVQGFRHDYHTRTFTPLHQSFVTMVAIDKEMVPVTVPQLAEQDEFTKDWDKMQKSLAEYEEMQKNAIVGSPAEEEDPLNWMNKTEFLQPDETELLYHHMYLPKDYNTNYSVFGGEILESMDKCAAYTARNFTKNQRCVVISMNRLTFHTPIYPNDLVEFQAQVIYVRRSTLEVEVVARVQRGLQGSGEWIRSHRANFILANIDESGFALPITTGLVIHEGNVESYARARRRSEFWRESIKKFGRDVKRGVHYG